MGLVHFENVIIEPYFIGIQLVSLCSAQSLSSGVRQYLVKQLVSSLIRCVASEAI